MCNVKIDMIRYQRNIILLGAAGVIAVAAVVYAIIKKNNPNK
jgi:hypothetical protein